VIIEIEKSSMAPQAVCVMIYFKPRVSLPVVNSLAKTRTAADGLRNDIYGLRVVSLS
jgi:hypothetical protein